MVGVSVLAWRQTVPAVRAEIVPTPRFLGVKTPLTVQLRAERGAVVSAELRLVQGQGRVVLANQAFSGGGREQKMDLTVDGRSTGLREGQATLEVRARDDFWRPLRVDDRPVLTLPVTLDFTPPTLEVLAFTRYLAQGGVGLVAFRSKGATRVGVNAGGRLLPRLPRRRRRIPGSSCRCSRSPGTRRVAPASACSLRTKRATRCRARSPPRSSRAGSRRTLIELKDDFLRQKVGELLPEQAQAQGDALVAAFLRVNRDQRKAAEQKKRELATRTQPRPLWEGAFVQPHNTKVFSNFAETRTYRFAGQEIDTQVHLGYDLASVKHSPIPAANAGVVLYAAPLTIYGNTVVLDHGWGLMTLYAHLSSLAVKEGDTVTKGQELGRTGTTGSRWATIFTTRCSSTASR